MARLWPEVHAWLNANVGRGEYARHAGGSIRDMGMDASAYYFRSTAAAHAFLTAFPQLELADLTTSPTYDSPNRRAPQAQWYDGVDLSPNGASSPKKRPT